MNRDDDYCSESRPVLRYDLSSNLSGSVILEDQPLYPGEYQVVLWQVTPAGTIMLASSVVLHATLHDSFMQTKEKDYQRQREIRILVFVCVGLCNNWKMKYFCIT